jgi:hypothetical protein
MTDFVEVKRLLDALAAVEDRLSANELEMYRSIKARYEEPGAGSFDDKTCLEVMLRNIEIRAGYGLDPGQVAQRSIELGRKRTPETPEKE